jgi:hypothetical protein
MVIRELMNQVLQPFLKVLSDQLVLAKLIATMVIGGVPQRSLPIMHGAIQFTTILEMLTSTTARRRTICLYVVLGIKVRREREAAKGAHPSKLSV